MRKLLFLIVPFILFAKEYIFAASWQNGYCATHQARECHKQYNYFTIHGLWPTKKNCNYKPLKVAKNLWNTLKIYMPSTKLIYHEWKKHGRCYIGDANRYFADSIYLIKKINEIFGEFFKQNRNKILSKQQLNRFINSIYPHTARKIKMICKNGYVTEIRFSLNGNIQNDNFYRLLKNGKNLKGGCEKGIIK
jgi:ribonuclease T2